MWLIVGEVGDHIRCQKKGGGWESGYLPSVVKLRPTVLVRYVGRHVEQAEMSSNRLRRLKWSTNQNHLNPKYTITLFSNISKATAVLDMRSSIEGSNVEVSRS